MTGLRRHVVIFTKAPRRGAAKTRLARDIGAAEAHRFYGACLRRVVRRLSGSVRWRCRLAVTPDQFARRGRFWPRRVPRVGQGAGDLGARMARPLRRLPPGPVVIVGSDAPEIRPHHIEQAFRMLGSHDAVFGPAADGGYWLIGLRRRPALIVPFGNVAWSSRQALSDTLANFPRSARVAFLDMLEDIDDGAAWRRWRAVHAR